MRELIGALKKSFLVIYLLLLNENLHSQDLGSIGKGDFLKISGGVSATNILYASSGSDRRSPYNYFLSGNINFDVLNGLSIPLTFTYSNQNSSFSQPFNQYSLHPKYKAFTTHIGYTSMSWSPYTLNGHIFLGGGVDYTPQGKINISAMGGRLQRAVTADTLYPGTKDVAFERWGGGLKISYSKDKDYLHFIGFAAKDNINSLLYIPEQENLSPEENLVLSINIGKAIGKRFFVKGEYANSAITEDSRAPKNKGESKNLYSYTSPIFTSRTSTAFYSAVKTGIVYTGSLYAIGVDYERIEPGYRTLGSYYFNNDLESISLNASARILKEKVNVAVNLGGQRNDLLGAELNSTTRMVGSLTCSYAASTKLNLSCSFSNFQTFTRIKSEFDYINQSNPYQNLDTLNFTQICQSGNLNSNYRLGSAKSKNKKSINLSLSYQQAADKQGGEVQNSGSRFYNSNASYNYSVTSVGLSITTAVNFSQNESSALKSTMVGPTLSLSKALFEKKVKSNLTSSWNNAYTNNDLVNTVINFRWTNSYVWRKKHNINFSNVILNRKGKNKDAFIEWTGNLGYSYNF